MRSTSLFHWVRLHSQRPPLVHRPPEIWPENHHAIQRCLSAHTTTLCKNAFFQCPMGYHRCSKQGLVLVAGRISHAQKEAGSLHCAMVSKRRPGLWRP